MRRETARAYVHELRKLVEEYPVHVVTLEELCVAVGYKKLSMRVLGAIGRLLEDQGLDYFPRVVEGSTESWGDQEVRIYLKSSIMGRVVGAVLNPSLASDTFLSEFAQPNESGAAEILEQIREIVGS